MMHPISAFILLVIWIAVTGSATTANIALGLAVAMLVLFVLRHHQPSGGYTVRIGAVLVLVLLFLRELALSAVQMAVLVAKPRMDLKPGIFAYRLRVKSDFEITLLANLITLTPGTLSVDVSGDRRTLYVHAIDCSDPDALRRGISNGFERRIGEAFGQ